MDLMSHPIWSRANVPQRHCQVVHDAVKYVKDKHSKRKVYHSADHCIIMAEAALTLAITEHVPTSLIPHLALAAVFHDFDHLCTPGDDSLNIARACAGFVIWAKNPGLNPSLQAMVQRLIQVTTYSSGFPVAPENLLERIMRDADLGSIYTEAGRKRLLYLPVELGIPLDEQFLTANANFLRTAVRFTTSALRQATTLDLCIALFDDRAHEAPHYEASSTQPTSV